MIGPDVRHRGGSQRPASRIVRIEQHVARAERRWDSPRAEQHRHPDPRGKGHHFRIEVGRVHGEERIAPTLLAAAEADGGSHGGAKGLDARRVVSVRRAEPAEGFDERADAGELDEQDAHRETPGGRSRRGHQQENAQQQVGREDPVVGPRTEDVGQDRGDQDRAQVVGIEGELAPRARACGQDGAGQRESEHQEPAPDLERAPGFDEAAGIGGRSRNESGRCLLQPRDLDEEELLPAEGRRDMDEGGDEGGS